jgi:hypothetical protein
MKNTLRRFLLSAAVVLTLGLVSCDASDMFLEDEIVGSWSCCYQDATVFEEEVYDFDPTGRWTYRYIYENIYGDYIYEVDAGTYSISYGRVVLKSNFSKQTYSLGLSFYNNRMILRDGEYYAEFLRYR